MKARTYRIYHGQSEYNFSGLHQYSQRYITTIPNIKPTVENVKKITAELFPEKTIETRWMTIKEHISEGMDVGFFSIPFYTKDDFISDSIVFDEVI